MAATGCAVQQPHWVTVIERTQCSAFTASAAGRVILSRESLRLPTAGVISEEASSNCAVCWLIRDETSSGLPDVLTMLEAAAVVAHMISLSLHKPARAMGADGVCTCTGKALLGVEQRLYDEQQRDQQPHRRLLPHLIPGAHPCMRICRLEYEASSGIDMGSRHCWSLANVWSRRPIVGKCSLAANIPEVNFVPSALCLFQACCCTAPLE